LGRLGDRRAVDYLLAELRRTESSTLRYTLIRALGNLGDPRAVEAIMSFEFDENHHVRAHAQRALSQLRH
jgi:HEAT repeat protein